MRIGHKHLPPAERSPSLSAVQLATNALRRLVLAAAEAGTFLGSEQQLIEQLGVSRPTFRQAAKLLSRESLLVIRRGAGGGFFSGAPSAAAVTTAVAAVLHLHKTSMRHISDVVVPLQIQAARLLAGDPDRNKRAQLLEAVAVQAADMRAGQLRSGVRQALAFERRLVELAGNPAILLAMEAMLGLLRDASRVDEVLTPERVLAHAVFQRRLAEAILRSDADVARLICLRHGALVRTWLSDEPIDDTLLLPR